MQVNGYTVGPRPFISGDRLESENRETLAYALPKEQQRVRELLPIYDAIPTGTFAAMMMRKSLARAEHAAAYGDVVAMLAAYEDLKGYDA